MEGKSQLIRTSEFYNFVLFLKGFTFQFNDNFLRTFKVKGNEEF